MVTLKTVNMQGAAQEAVEVSETVFNAVVSETLVHDVVVGMLAALHRGTHSTKTRGEVSGGGAKPFRQKGTGRARRGSSREPHLKGGGTVFGPHPHSYRHSLSTSMKRRALCGLLSDRVRTERLCVLADMAFTQAKTKSFASMLTLVAPNERRTLLVTAQHDKNVLMSSRNIPNVSVRTAAEVSPLDVIRATQIVLQKEALTTLEERLA